MGKERIELENLLNTRDLGGYVNKEGKRIKYKRLIRSGTLYKASESDIQTLCKEYDLKKVIDLRNKEEMWSEPDPVIEGVEHVWCPIFVQRDVSTITREKRWDDSDPLGLYLFFAEEMMGRGDETPWYYTYFAKDPNSITYYQKLFDELLEQEEGATLWHCSAGKDRCGVGTVYLLKALGMEDELIYEDYLLTNYYYQDLTDQMIALAKERGLGDSFEKVVRLVNGVCRSYLDTLYATCEELYGSMDAFLEKGLGLTADKIDRLKDLYLE
ncbi:MAG: tyrosine-protein phosphatase [Erysipelotrichales bacterium]|nr:tyrosine-protein phosphatase [Erysipelotrichales bacterium]